MPSAFHTVLVPAVARPADSPSAVAPVAVLDAVVARLAAIDPRRRPAIVGRRTTGGLTRRVFRWHSAPVPSSTRRGRLFGVIVGPTRPPHQQETHPEKAKRQDDEGELRQVPLLNQVRLARVGGIVVRCHRLPLPVVVDDTLGPPPVAACGGPARVDVPCGVGLAVDPVAVLDDWRVRDAVRFARLPVNVAVDLGPEYRRLRRLVRPQCLLLLVHEVATDREKQQREHDKRHAREPTG